MYEWQRQIQMIVDEIDNCIKNHDDEALTLCALAKRLGYSEFHIRDSYFSVFIVAFHNPLSFNRVYI